MTTFADLGLRPATLRAIEALGWREPTPIQRDAIPLLLQGEDLIGQAQTGTGKTGAFGIPIVEAAEGRGIQALVLCPTRELALQVEAELNEIGSQTPAFKAAAVYGGVGMGGQKSALSHRSTTCVVATPGRLLDHLQQGTAELGFVRILVLDEADRMLDMGFLPDVERILANVPKDRQTMLFSATMPDEIRALAKRHMRSPEFVRTGEDTLATPLARQVRVEVEKDHKFPTLVALLAREGKPRAIVFTRTKHGASRLGRRLEKSGFAAVALQGDMSQNQRVRALDAFREGRARVLVATDVAARGLDIPDVTHVVNYDIPEGDPEAYVHRIGRTGRMGREGRAFLFVEPGQDGELREIEKLLGSRIDREAIEVDEDALAESKAKAEAGRAASQSSGHGRRHGRHAPGGHGHHAGHASHARRDGGAREGARRDGRPGRGGGRGGGRGRR